MAGATLQYYFRYATYPITVVLIIFTSDLPVVTAQICAGQQNVSQRSGSITNTDACQFYKLQPESLVMPMLKYESLAFLPYRPRVVQYLSSLTVLEPRQTTNIL